MSIADEWSADMAKAVQFDHYGDIDVLYLADVEVPAASNGEVVIKVHAAGINPGEASIRQGYLDSMFPATFPSGEGSDLAGEITEVGEGVADFAAGHADYVAVPATQIVAKPAGLSWVAAGALYVVGVTAYAAVRAVAAGPGDTVVVSAAAGGVGSVVVGLLKTKGCTVIGIASEANHPWLASLGVTPVAYGDGLADRLRSASPNGIDAFIDLFGPDYVRLAVDLGVKRDRIETIIAFQAAQEYGTKSEGSSDASTTEVLAEMADLVASGQIDLPIAATYRLDEVQDAYRELEQRHTRGKIVLVP
jgi:NADPH2:quinone reductase